MCLLQKHFHEIGIKDQISIKEMIMKIFGEMKQIHREINAEYLALRNH